MRHILLVVLLLALSTPARADAPDPHLTAQWDSATSATIQWTQTARGCLERQPKEGAAVFIGCYERLNATIIVTLGHVGPLSGDLRPTAGDVYKLTINGQVFSAPLIGRPVYLPLFL